MPPFAEFFVDEAAVGMSGVEAADAEALVLKEQPGGKAHAVDSPLVTDVNRGRMLGAWLHQQG